MPTFFSIFKTELYKSFKNKELFVFLALGIVPVIISFLMWYNHTLDQFQSAAWMHKDKNPWMFFYQYIYVIEGFLFSFVLIAFVYINIDAEHTAKTWKSIYSIPKMTRYFLWAKQLALIFWVFVMLQLQYVFIVIATILLQSVNTAIPYQSNPAYYGILWLIQLKVLIASLPIIVFQVWFNALIPKNILINLLILILSWFLYSKYLPHSELIIVCFKTFFYDIKRLMFLESFHLITFTESYSMLWVVIISVIGYFITPKIIDKLT